MRDASVEALLGHATAYTVGAGDVLQITVWDHPELAAASGSPSPAAARTFDPPPGFIIDDTGSLRFPFAGNIHVQGHDGRRSSTQACRGTRQVVFAILK